MSHKRQNNFTLNSKNAEDGIMTLQITTDKRKEHVASTALIGYSVQKEGYSTFTTAIFKDFFKNITPNTLHKRATQKAIDAVHAETMAQLATIIEHVKNHYNNPELAIVEKE